MDSPTPTPTSEPSADNMLIQGFIIGAVILVVAALYALCIKNRSASVMEDPLLQV